MSEFCNLKLLQGVLETDNSPIPKPLMKHPSVNIADSYFIVSIEWAFYLALRSVFNCTFLCYKALFSLNICSYLMHALYSPECAVFQRLTTKFIVTLISASCRLFEHHVREWRDTPMYYSYDSKASQWSSLRSFSKKQYFITGPNRQEPLLCCEWLLQNGSQFQMLVFDWLVFHFLRGWSGDTLQKVQ